MSSRDFAESSSSSLVPSMAACGVKVAAENPRRQPGQTAGTEVAYRGLAGPPCFCVPLHGTTSDKHRGPRNNPKLLACYQQASYTLTAAVWTRAGSLPTMAFTRETSAYLKVGVSKWEKCQFLMHSARPEPHPSVPSMPN
eukprot:1158277-Pelagomonas_calceolata.AAC.1